MCRKPEAEKSRLLWGCDVPAEHPVFRMTCVGCAGYHPECDRCGGTGYVPLYRCPGSMTDGPTSRAVAAYMVLDRHGTWPSQGGSYDQAAAFVDMVRLVDSERATIDNERQEREERKQRHAAAHSAR